MKKIFMSIFALLLCTASLASESTQADKQIRGNNSVTVVTETIESRKKDMTLKVSQDLMKTAFYSIDRITIENKHNFYIRIENYAGVTILETHDSVDIQLPEGNYYVYTSCLNFLSLYKY
jgi:hypothetical protein